MSGKTASPNRGRPPMPPHLARTETVSQKLSPAELLALQRIGTRVGKPFRAVLRDAMEALPGWEAGLRKAEKFLLRKLKGK